MSSLNFLQVAFNFAHERRHAVRFTRRSSNNMAQSQFDIEDALSRLADVRLPMPLDIPIIVESEVAHEHEVVVPPAPRPEPEADLASALRAFQNEDNERFGRQRESVPFNNDDVELSPDDYMDYSDQDSEDEGMDEDTEDDSMEEPRPPEEPNRRVDPDSEVQAELDQVQQYHERRSVAENPLEVFQVNSETVQEVHFGELFVAGVVIMESDQDQSFMMGAEGFVLTKDHVPASPDQLPPIEEKFIKEILSTQIGPASSGVSVSLTVAASPSPSSQLPSTSSLTNFVMCQSSLEIVVTSASADHGTSVPEDSAVKEAADDGSNILAGESVKNPAV